MRACVLLPCVVVAAAVADGSPKVRKPSKVEALKPLQPVVAGARSVSDVLADLGDGRFPVLFVVRGNHCIERVIDGHKDRSCSPTSTPHVAVVHAGADGKPAVEKQLALPTEAPPWDLPEELKWGITFVKDYDGDGRPELMVAYGYNGPNEWGVGFTYYKNLVIVNLDDLNIAFETVVDVAPQAESAPESHGKWKLAPNGAGFDIEIARRRRTSGQGMFEDFRERWIHGAGDIWHKVD
jgi:hypothetical protein